MKDRIRGVLAPVVTPFDAQGSVDLARFVRQCTWLQSQGVGLAILGTNSEANSLSPTERHDMIDALCEAGVDTARMMPGTGACDLPTAVALSRQAVRAGCAGVLVLPPFYYKGVSDEGLFRFYASLIEQVADPRLRVYLYHIPGLSQVGISPLLIDRLLARYPESIAGIKDSSGDWANTQTLLTTFANRGFDVFVGSETYLLAGLRQGGAGCISATANVNPAAIRELFQQWQSDDADERQARLDVVRRTFEAFPMIPALKAAIAHWQGDDAWRHVRAPLMRLPDAQREDLIARLTAAGFGMPDA